MTALLLYDYPLSICCQMVRLTLAEKNLAYDKQLVDIDAAHDPLEP